ncbi:unnamed protein product, partial [Penicillium discolor]
MSSTPFQPPSPVPPRTSSANATNGTGSPSHRRNLSVTDEEPTRTGHRRNRSSVDGTKYKDGTWSSKNDKILMGPYDYVHEQPGKDIRRQLIHAFNAWLQVPPASLAIITKVVTMLHTSSL